MYSTRGSARFRIKGWIDDEEFDKLREIARYLGSYNGYKLFELDLDRAKANGYTPGDILSLLSSINGIVDEDLDRVRRILEETSKVIIYLADDGWLRVGGRIYLKPLLRELGIYLPYDRESSAYKAPPHMYRRLVEFFRSKGLLVDDRLGLIDDNELPRRMEFHGELRPYQDEAFRAWLENGGQGIIALPTGAGKTVIAIAAMAKLNKRTLIVVYTKEHVKQWIDAIARFSNAAGMTGAYYSEEKRLAPITVTTYQSAHRYIKKLAPHFSLAIFDEAHHLPAEKFRAIAVGLPAPYRLGLSATPEREDGKHEELFPLLGGVVYRSSPGELTSRGYLAPYVIRTIKVDLDPDEKSKYKALRRKYFNLARGRSFQELLRDAKNGDPDAIEALRVHKEMEKIVQYSKAKLRAVEKIVRDELMKGNKIIVFTQLRGQAEEIARRVGGLLLHGGIDKKRRDLVLEKFKRASKGVLVLTTVGDEGLDIPDASVGILVSGTGSPRQFIQRLGRLLRPSPGKQGAILYEVIVKGTMEEFRSRKRKNLGLPW